MNFAIGLPAFNEEKNIGSIIIKLKELTKNVIVCDDGSTDLTSKIASELGAITIVHQKNMGYGAAISSLFSKAREIGVDALVTFDADGQHRFEDIKAVLEPVIRDEADIAIGSRFMGDDSMVPRYRKIGIKTITGLTNVTTGSKITDAQSGFRAYNKKVLESIIPSEHGMGVSTEILIKSAKSKFRIAEVPITIRYDGETSTHNAISHGSSVIISTLKYVSIERPLPFYGIPGIILLTIGLAFSIWAIQVFVNERELITNIALIGIAGVIVGIVLLITAIILYSIISVIREHK
ncbi:MAG: glycosyltransferase family 2 protein [Thaumarchaeota archaeon]|nr:glycosyltransferase family 2 protein [Nitrososphaerota archaeon]